MKWNTRGEVFVVVQFILLIALVLWRDPVGWPRLELPALLAMGFALRWLGLLVLLVAGLGLGRNLTALPKPKSDGSLVTTGLYALVRHPIYAGLLAFAFGLALERGSLVSLVLSVALLVLLEFKSRREEAWLLERFPEYAAYQKRVRKFVPGVY